MLIIFSSRVRLLAFPPCGFESAVERPALGGVENRKRHLGIVPGDWFNGDGKEKDASRLLNQIVNVWF